MMKFTSKKSKRWAVIIACMGLSLTMVSCNNPMVIGNEDENKNITQEISYLAYSDEELGFTFQVEEDLYANLLCEISQEENDEILEQSRIDATFYLNSDGVRSELFTIHLFEGNLEEAYVLEKNSDLIYLGTAGEYTYTLTVAAAGEAIVTDEFLSMITLQGPLEGTFAEEELDIVTSSSKTDYEKAIVTIEGIEEEVTVATLHSVLGFSYQYQSDYFAYTAKSNGEYLVGQDTTGVSYPNIYFNVEKLYDTTVDTVMEESEYEGSYNKTTIGVQDYSAYYCKYDEDDAISDIIEETYLVQCEEDVFAIHMGYFTEATEGYGVRLHSILDSFSLTTPE